MVKTKMSLIHKYKIKFIATLFVLILLFFLPIIYSYPYFKHVMIMVFVYAILAEAWNILGGYCGQVSLGNAIFFGVGAYISTVLFINFKINPWIGLLLGGILAIIVAIIIGYPVFRLRQSYFAIATIASGEIIRIIAQNWDYIGAQIGLELPLMEDSLKNMTFLYNKDGFYYILLSILIIFVILIHFLLKSKIGHYFKMIRGEENLARSIGINTRAYKLVAISISAFFTAITGTCYVQYLLFVNPDMVFSLNVSVKIVLIAAFGGVGTIWGPLLGAFVLIPILEGSRIFFGGAGEGVDWLIFGVLILIINLFRPGGIITFFQKK